MNEGGAAAGHVLGGRYELVAEIGHGGMGRVWEARDTQLDRAVAVKEVLLPALPAAQREMSLRLAFREAKNAAALADHPNIVTVYDVLLENGSPWIVMQLVRGRSLRHVLHGSPAGRTAADADARSAPVGVAQTVRIAEAMLDALAALHTLGLVHRDIKPHNIMLANDGRVLLTDFGIAKSESDVTVTVSGSVVGTMAYIAPERVEGESGTSASDLFSLGVTLFEAVEGYSPFDKGNLTGTLSAILTKPLPPMAKAGPLAPLITALTLKLPKQRPDNAQARRLLANGRADGWGTASGDEASIDVRPAAPDDTHPKTLAAPAGAARTPYLPTVTAPRSRPEPVRAKSDPKPKPQSKAKAKAGPKAGPKSGPSPKPSTSTSPSPEPSPKPDSTARKALGPVAGAVVVIAVIGAVLIHQRHQATTSQACETWRAGMEQHNTWVYSGLTSGLPTETEFARQEDLLVAVEQRAATQTSDKTLKTWFQQAAADHIGLAAAYRAQSAGRDGDSGYNHYSSATNHDDVEIQALCNKQ